MAGAKKTRRTLRRARTAGAVIHSSWYEVESQTATTTSEVRVDALIITLLGLVSRKNQKNGFPESGKLISRRAELSDRQ
jgi:hypothetical protein